MSRSLSNTFTLILAVAGGIIALWLTVEHYLPQVSLPCTVSGSGCKGTLESSYGHVGPIPTAFFGLGMYAFLAVLCVERRKRLQARQQAEAANAAAYASAAETVDAGTPEGTDAGSELATGMPPLERPAPAREAADVSLALLPSVKPLDMAIWILSLLGFGISWFLQYTALFVLITFCPWCFSSAVIVTLIFILASRDFLLDGRKFTGEQKLLAGVVSFILALLAVVYAPEVTHQFGIVFSPTPVTQGPERFPVDMLVSKTMPIKGDPKAPYLIVEFADYQCPHCQKAVAAVDTMLEQRPHQLRLGFRNFPLMNHVWARPAAVAALAAGKQGKFWQMHDTIFVHQEELEGPDFRPSRFDDFARDLKLNIAEFDHDQNDADVIKQVEADVETGNRVGVISTPTFFFIRPGNPVPYCIGGLEDLVVGIADPKSQIWK